MKRGPDGKTIRPGDGPNEEATRRVQNKSIRDRISVPNPEADADADPDAETRIAGDDPFEAEEDTGEMGKGGGYIDDDDNTGPTTPSGERARTVPSDDGAKTQVYRPRKASAAAKSDDTSAADAKAGGDREKPAIEPGDDMFGDPVVAWIVVTEGPGRGASFALGYGNNRIGRAHDQTVVLDFGDEQISRENHATITYDGKNRRFFVKEGDGRNLVYVGDDPVLTPVELKGDEVMVLGETKVKFVAFCGKDFDWNEK